MNYYDSVWIFTHDIGYVQIYKGTFLAEKGRRVKVKYEEMFFDNDRDRSLAGTTRDILRHNVFSSFKDMIDNIDKELVIKNILDSQKVAK